MSGITSGIGLASGINTQQIIQSLLALEARPRTLAQQRLAQLQTQQAAYLDLNSRLGTLRSAAAKFRTSNVFQTKRASSSVPEVLTATASTAAQQGSYTMLVDRLVTSQQFLSKGFADQNTSALGASSFTFESAVARLDRDTDLADLNGGEGIQRGKIVLTVNGTGTTVDLSKAATVNEVLEAINGSGTGVTASVEGGAFVLRAANTTDTLVVSNTGGTTTAADLGIAGTAASGVLSGGTVYSLTGDTALASLNDGNGVDIGDDRTNNPEDFTITVGTVEINVYLGDVWEDDPENPGTLIITQPAVSTLGQAVARINEKLAEDLPAAGYGASDVQVAIASDGTRLELTNNSGASVVVENRKVGSNYRSGTASDLGLAERNAPTTYGTGSTTAGKRIFAGLNSTLTRNLNGGTGIGVNGLGQGELSFTDRAGTSATVTFDPDASVADIVAAINDLAPPNIQASLNAEGTGILIKDTTATGAITGNLIVEGASAESLGLDTGPTGVDASVKDSDNLQHAYIRRGTLVSELNNGNGIGTGIFRLTGPNGATRDINIGDDTKTVAQLLQELDSAASELGLRARINDRGDGIIVEETNATPGIQKIKIEDISGTVAKALRIAGEAEGTGAENFLDGSYETTVEFGVNDTLQDVVTKINNAGAGVAASILNSGSSSKPFRISLASRESGTAGRLVIDTNGFDLGLETLDAGTDARVFLGSTDPAKAILLQSSTNTLDRAISGVSIDLLTRSDDPVELTVSQDTAAFESAVTEFISAFNGVIKRIDDQSTYNQDTNRRGIFLGDNTAQSIRQRLFSAIQDDGSNLTGSFKFLTQVGIGFKDGELTFDKDRFRQALEEDFDAVVEIFAAREQEIGSTFQPIAGIPGASVKVGQDERGFTKLGVVGALEELIKDYVDTIDGTLAKRSESLDAQIKLQQDRITLLTAKLQSRQGILERQFAGMEQAISALQSQGTVLGQIQQIG
ncbi:MAG: flagellar filament capping protein FliD [Phycisphaerales bacterium]